MIFDISIVGGAGHVGLPLALAFANSGSRVLIQDRNSAALEEINAGRMPFTEDGAEEILPEVLKSGRLATSCDPASIGSAKAIIVTIGTPVDEYLNPGEANMHTTMNHIEALAEIDSQIASLADQQRVYADASARAVMLES